MKITDSIIGYLILLQTTQLSFTGCAEIPLIVAKDNGLVYVNVQDASSHRISRLGMPFSIDYIEQTTNMYQLFWSDLTGRGIMKGILQNEKLTNVTTFISTNGARVEGISINWLSRHIYWIVPDAGIIEIATLDGKFRAPLISGLSSPRALAVDPDAGFLFWSDVRTTSPRIQRSKLSGHDVFTVVELSDRDSKSINGITLDCRNHVIYWVEARSETIHKVTYDGVNHEVIHKNNYLTHPVGIALYGNKIIWSDQNSGKVIQVDGDDEENILYETYSNIYGIKLLEKHRMAATHNRCSTDNGDCSHFCFSDKIGIECGCAYGYRLAGDGKLCKKLTGELDVIFNFGKKQSYSSSIFKQDLENLIWPNNAVDFHYKACHITALDYDQERNLYYLLDKTNNKVLEAHNGTVKNIFAISEDTTSFVMDYLENNAFIAVGGQNPHIALCSLESKDCKPFIYEKIVHPTDIALQIKNRNLVWIDKSETQAKIMFVNLNNHDHGIIAVGENLCCLTIDVKTDRVWWIDLTKLAVVSQYHSKLAKSEVPYSEHFQPVSLAVVDDIIYIASNSSVLKIRSDARSSSIYSFKNEGRIAAVKALIFTEDAAENTSHSFNFNALHMSSLTLHEIDVTRNNKSHESTNPTNLDVPVLNHTECVHLCIHKGDCVYSSDKQVICRCPHLASYSSCAQQHCTCVHGDCVVTNDEFGCICDSGFESSSCDIPSCNNMCVFGNCSIIDENASCSCDSDWEGSRCDEPKISASKFCFDWCQSMPNYTEEKAELCRCHSRENAVSVHVRNIIIGILLYMITVLLLSGAIYLCIVAARKNRAQSTLELEQNVGFLSDQKLDASETQEKNRSWTIFVKLKKLHNKITLFWQLHFPSLRIEFPEVTCNHSCPSTESEV